MIQFLVANPLVTACLWAALYFFDYSATVWFAQVYRRSLKWYFTYDGGMEMNPVFARQVASLRQLSPQFLFLLSLMTTVLVVSGRYGRAYVNYQFIVGAFLLLWVFIDLRHLRNIYFYQHLTTRPGAVEGHLRQSYWLSQRLTAFDAFSAGVVYGLAWAAGGQDFFLGGAFVCFALAVRHFFLANRRPEVAPSPGTQMAIENERLA
jgi:hypothetical protein